MPFAAPPLIMDGFEHGVTGAPFVGAVPTSLGPWTLQSGAWTITTSNPRGGGAYGLRSFQSNPTAGVGYIRQAFASFQPVIVLRFGLYFTTFPANNVVIFTFFQNAQINAGLRYTTGPSKLSLVTSGGTVSSSTITTGVWYLVEFRMDLSANPHTYAWQIDGVAQTTGTSNVAADSFYQITVGPSVSATMDMQIDDFVLTTSAADYPIGDGYITPVIPNGPGTHSFTAGDFDSTVNTGGAFTPVVTSPSTDLSTILGQVPINGTTSYIRQDVIRATGYIEHTCNDLPANAAVVNAVRGCVGYNSTTTTANQGAVGAYRSSDATYLEIYGNPTTRADFSETGVTCKANNLVLNGTTPAEVNGLTIRIGYSGDVTPNPQWHGVMLQVDHTVSTGTNYTDTHEGTITSSGVAAKLTNDTLAGTLTSVGALVVVKTLSKILTAALTSVGLTTKLNIKPRGGTLTSAGVATRTKFIGKALAGAFSPAGALQKAGFKAFAGSLNVSGLLTRFTLKVLAGAFTSAATIVRVKTALKALAGAVTPASPTLVRAKTATRALAGAITPTAALARVASFVRTFTGASTLAGAVAKVGNKPLAGVLTPSATIVRVKSLMKLLGGTLTPAGALTRVKSAFRVLAGAFTPAAVMLLVKTATRAFAGSILPASALVRAKTAGKSLVGALSPAGSWSHFVQGGAEFLNLSGELDLNDQLHYGYENFIIPLYQYPSFAGSSWNDLDTGDPAGQAVVIANPATGPGTSVNSDWTAALNAAVTAGYELVGYVHVSNWPTDNDVRALSAVEADMANWMSFYPQIGGFFFDLTPTGALGDRKSYMQDLRDSADAAFGGTSLLFANPGTWPLEEGYLLPMDVTCVQEGFYSSYLAVEVPSYATGYASHFEPDRLAHIIHDCPDSTSMKTAFRHSRHQGVQWFYATDASNYQYLATYWADEAIADQTLNNYSLLVRAAKAAALAPVGAAAKLVGTVRSGALSPSAAISRLVTRTRQLTGTLTSSGRLTQALSAVKKGVLAFAGTLTAAGSGTLSLTGALSPSGAVTRVASYSRVLSGNLTSTGAAARVALLLRNLTGSVTPASTLVRAKTFGRAFAGAVTPAATIVRVKLAARTFAGAISPSGALVRLVSLFKSGSLSPTGLYSREGAASLALFGAISSSGRAAKAATHTLAGQISLIGASPAFVRFRGTNLGGILGFSGNSTRIVSKVRALSGSLSLAGAIQLFGGSGMTLGGALNPSGAFKKAVSWTKSGQIVSAGVAYKTFVRSRAGVLSFAGAATRALQRGRTLSGTLTASGSMGRATAALRGGALDPAGILTRSSAKKLVGAVSLSGLVLATRARFITLASGLSFNGLAARVRIKPKQLVGTLAFTGTKSVSVFKHLIATLDLVGLILRVHFKGTAAVADLTATDSLQVLLVAADYERNDFDFLTTDRPQVFLVAVDYHRVDFSAQFVARPAVMAGEE